MTIPENQPDAVIEAWWNSPRTCAKCNHTGQRRDFPMTTCRGKFILRTWCHECLGAYYRYRSAQKRKKEAIEGSK